MSFHIPAVYHPCTNPQSALLTTPQSLNRRSYAMPSEFRAGERKHYPVCRGPGPGLCDVDSCGTSREGFPGVHDRKKLALWASLLQGRAPRPSLKQGPGSHEILHMGYVRGGAAQTPVFALEKSFRFPVLRRFRSRWNIWGPEPQAGGKVRETPGRVGTSITGHIPVLASVIEMPLLAPASGGVTV